MFLAAQKRNQPPKSCEEQNELFVRQGSLPKCTGSASVCCWNTPEPETFFVRGKSYLRDQSKVGFCCCVSGELRLGDRSFVSHADNYVYQIF